MLAQKLLSGGGVEPLYVDDVFQSYVRTGTGASAAITTGFQPDLVWTKQRTASSSRIFDSARGVGKRLVSDSTGDEAYVADTLTSFNPTGYTYGADATIGGCNYSGNPYVDWVLKKAPKFFDVVTYAGTNVSGHTVPHSLGVAPGMIIVKCTVRSSTAWSIYHRSLGATKYLEFDTGAEGTAVGYWNNTEPTDTHFTLGNDGNVNYDNYVAYLFAHDPSADGIIQCGSFTTDGSGNATVNHGWTAGVQFAMIKASSTTGDWEMYDTARTSGWTGSDARLRANLPNAEDAVTRLSASGTSVSFTGLSASQAYIYVFVVSPT